MPSFFQNFGFPKRHKCTCGMVNVKAYGAKGNYNSDANTGKDDTAAIQNAINAAAARGETLCFPPGKYKVTGALALPADFRLTGASAANCTLITPAASSFPVFDINGRTRIHLSDISVEYGENPAVPTAGLYIHDGASDILIERCVFKGGNIPILIRGSDSKPVQNITLRDVQANSSPLGWGIELDHCENISLFNCSAGWNGLDGLKIIRKTFNVLVEGGHYDNNGSEHPDFGFSGDGIDLAQGGDRTTIRGCTCDNNVANGITIKYVAGDANVLGHVRNILITDVRCRGNGRLSNNGNGINGQGRGQNSTFGVHDVVITGGLIEENASNGILCNMSHTVIQGTIVKNNRQTGIRVERDAHFVTISNARCIRNGINTDGNGTASNIGIYNTTHVKVLGCTCLGVDPVILNAKTLQELETAAAALQIPGSEAGLSKWNLLVQEAQDVEVSHFTGRYSQIPGQPGAGDRFGVRIDPGSQVLVHHHGEGNPSVIGAPGTRGSHYMQTDPSPNTGPVWVKTSDKTSSNLDDQKADWVSTL